MDALDKYRLEEPLGEGGMARVFRAVDTSLQRPVVIKMMKLGLDPSERERFLAEARALCKLRSKHLLEVLDFGESAGSFYFVMPFVQVASLADLMERRKREKRSFSPAEAAWIMAQVARALEEAHRNQIVHRDVKPQNILVGLGRVYLTDFGIARDLESEIDLTQKGTVVGTPRYMAPDQIRGARVDFGADLYSVGLILFELLAGRLPGEPPTGDLAAMLRHRLDGGEDPLAAVRPDAALLAPLVDGLLGPAARRSIATAAALAGALGPLAAGADASAEIQADVDALLGPGERLPLASTWTTVGRKASTLLPAAGSEPSASAVRRPTVPPLSRPTPAAPKPPAREASRRRPAALAGGAALAALLALWLLAGSRPPAAPSITSARATAGFQRIRLEWSGAAKELSLVNPRGHEELYDVRERQQWESGALAGAGTYSASLIPAAGEPVVVPPIEFKPMEPGAVETTVHREMDEIRVEMALPVDADAEAILRAEGLSVQRASSTTAARRQTLRLTLDPAEAASLQLRYRSRLGEETSGPAIELPALLTALRAASKEVLERVATIDWKSFYGKLFRLHRSAGGGLRPTALAELPALGLGGAFRSLQTALPGYLASSRVPLEDKMNVYWAVMRLADPYFWLERNGLDVVAPVYASLPATWVCSSTPTLPSPEELRIPFEGIMSFKPRADASVDFQNEVTRVEQKEAKLELKDVAGVRAAEVMLETWALKPDQIFALSINDRVELEMRARGQEFARRHAAKQTLPLYHRLDPAALVEGTNRFRLCIRVVPGGDPTDSAALNSASLRLERRGSGDAPGATAGAGAGAPAK